MAFSLLKKLHPAAGIHFVKMPIKDKSSSAVKPKPSVAKRNGATVKVKPTKASCAKEDSESKGHSNNESSKAEAPKEVLKATYRSRCGKYIFIRDAAGEYIRHTFLDRPEEKWFNLQSELKLNGDPYNNRLYLNMQAHVRKDMNGADIPVGTTWPRLDATIKSQITTSVMSKYPYLKRCKANWGAEEILMRTLQNRRDTCTSNKKRLEKQIQAEKRKSTTKKREEAPAKRPRKNEQTAPNSVETDAEDRAEEADLASKPKKSQPKATTSARTNPTTWDAVKQHQKSRQDLRESQDSDIDIENNDGNESLDTSNKTTGQTQKANLDKIDKGVTLTTKKRQRIDEESDEEPAFINKSKNVKGRKKNKLIAEPEPESNTTPPSSPTPSQMSPSCNFPDGIVVAKKAAVKKLKRTVKPAKTAKAKPKDKSNEPEDQDSVDPPAADSTPSSPAPAKSNAKKIRPKMRLPQQEEISDVDDTATSRAAKKELIDAVESTQVL